MRHHLQLDPLDPLGVYPQRPSPDTDHARAKRIRRGNAVAWQIKLLGPALSERTLDALERLVGR